MAGLDAQLPAEIGRHPLHVHPAVCALVSCGAARDKNFSQRVTILAEMQNCPCMKIGCLRRRKITWEKPEHLRAWRKEHELQSEECLESEDRSSNRAV